MIEQATIDDVPLAAAMLAGAFANDEIMTYFFGAPTAERQVMAREFFEILMAARVSLSMPVFVAKPGGRIAGVVMGTDVTRPAWLPEHTAWWAKFEAKQVGLAERVQRQEEGVDRFRPQAPHYYLGVVGVDPAVQGQGVGTALISRIFAASDADAASTGVYIETGSPVTAAYYQRLGFEPAGEVDLDPVTRMRTLFRASPTRA